MTSERPLIAEKGVLIMPMRKVGGGTRWGTLVPCYEPTQSTLAI